MSLRETVKCSYFLLLIHSIAFNETHTAIVLTGNTHREGEQSGLVFFLLILQCEEQNNQEEVKKIAHDKWAQYIPFEETTEARRVERGEKNRTQKMAKHNKATTEQEGRKINDNNNNNETNADSGASLAIQKKNKTKSL